MSIVIPSDLILSFFEAEIRVRKWGAFFTPKIDIPGMKKVPQEKKQHFFTSKHLDFLHYSLTYYFWLYSLLASFLSLCISFCYYAKVL